MLVRQHKIVSILLLSEVNTIQSVTSKTFILNMVYGCLFFSWEILLELSSVPLYLEQENN